MNEPDLLSFLPEPWVPWIRIIAEVSFVLSLLAVPLKGLLGQPKPGADPRWKQVVFFCMHAIDFLAVNTTTIREKSKQVKKEMTSSARATIPPPAATLLVFLALSLAPVVHGCASTLHQHAVAADTSASLIDETRMVIERELRAAEEGALARSTTRDEAADAVAAVRASYRPIESAYEALRRAHEAYVDAIVHAEALGHDQPSLPTVHALRSAWAVLVELAQAAGLKMPAGAPALPGGK